jgi:hypothetical protein
MRRKVIYIVTLVILFLMWGVWGVAAVMSRSVASAESALSLSASSTVNPGTTQQAMIPVTGSGPSEMEVLVFYALAGLGALSLILALLSSANQWTAPYPPQKEFPSAEDSKE